MIGSDRRSDAHAIFLIGSDRRSEPNTVLQKKDSGKKRMCGSADMQRVKCGCKCGSTSAFYQTYSWQLALIVNDSDWIFVIVPWMSSLDDAVEHSKKTKKTCTAKCCVLHVGLHTQCNKKAYS